MHDMASLGGLCIESIIESIKETVCIRRFGKNAVVLHTILHLNFILCSTEIVKKNFPKLAGYPVPDKKTSSRVPGRQNGITRWVG